MVPDRRGHRLHLVFGDRGEHWEAEDPLHAILRARQRRLRPKGVCDRRLLVVRHGVMYAGLDAAFLQRACERFAAVVAVEADDEQVIARFSLTAACPTAAIFGWQRDALHAGQLAAVPAGGAT